MEHRGVSGILSPKGTEPRLLAHHLAYSKTFTDDGPGGRLLCEAEVSVQFRTLMTKA